MPGGLYGRLSGRSASRVSAELRDQIQEMVTQGRTEPLARELLREASVNDGLNRRSALILAVAAAEAGVKQCISELVPDASWLVETGPSPGLVDMLKNYLPSLPCKGKINDQVPTIPKAIRRVLDDAVKQRNKLVHVGMGQPTADEVHETLTAVEDVLWLCDFYRGHEWALKYLSSATRAAFGLV
jgi:malonyl CoA-acyl carrier protein transacylase